MKVLAFNGSPLKKSTTAILLDKALKGAASKGAETEMIQLNDLNMKGCQSCFACKMRGGKSYGKCVLKDDMALVYEKIEQSDTIIVGSPIYFGGFTGQTKLFQDRLFPYVSYKDYSSLLPEKKQVGLIYTMNMDNPELYEAHIKMNERMFSMIFGSAESLVSCDTFHHIKDYSMIVGDALEAVADRKKRYRDDIFPGDCDKAFNMGDRFAMHS